MEVGLAWEGRRGEVGKRRERTGLVKWRGRRKGGKGGEPWVSGEWKVICMIYVYDTYGVWMCMISEDGRRGYLDPSRRGVRYEGRRWRRGGGWLELISGLGIQDLGGREGEGWGGDGVKRTKRRGRGLMYIVLCIVCYM